jgi:hypothetical protein
MLPSASHVVQCPGLLRCENRKGSREDHLLAEYFEAPRQPKSLAQVGSSEKAEYFRNFSLTIAAAVDLTENGSPHFVSKSLFRHLAACEKCSGIR